MLELGFMLIARMCTSSIGATVTLIIRSNRKKKLEISQKMDKISEKSEK